MYGCHNRTNITSIAGPRETFIHGIYHEMGYHRHQKWDLERRKNPALAAALVSLSDSGGVSNGDLEKWRAYLGAVNQHIEVLHSEYVANIERALWRMRMFRWKRRSLDMATQKLLKKATDGVPLERPLVFAVGDAGFASTGRGELPAPTSALMVAFKRALARVSRAGRRVVVLTINEFRTTLCCCACGSVTRKPMVGVRTRAGDKLDRGSGRLRECTTCETTGKLRDRDEAAFGGHGWQRQPFRPPETSHG